jgi:predicted nucleotidyltransferase
MPDIAIPIDKDQLRDFCRRWKITEFALFGSATRPEEFRSDSDVDVLVRFEPAAKWDLSAWIDMRDELGGIFGREVDLAERDGVEQMRNYLRRAAILETAVVLDVA